jgi:two-component system, OmpR family, sensor kinase
MLRSARFQRFNTVRNRLLFLFFAITAAAVGFVYLYVVPQLQSSLTAEKLSRLEDRSIQQSARLQRALREGLPQAQLTILLRRVAQATDSRVTLLGVRASDGSPAPSFVIGDSEPTAGSISSRYNVAAGSVDGQTRAGTEVIGGSRSAEVAVPIPKGNPTWIVVFSQSLAEVSDNVALIKRQILIAGGIALLLSLLAGFWAARAISRRLRRLDAAARRVALGDFAPIPVDSSDELGQLARTFNDMQRRLEEVDEARKQFIAHASHELRTPIFSLGGFVELLDEEDPDPEARAEFVQTMREQIARLTKLTTDLLDLSKLDAGAMEISSRTVDLGELATEIAKEFGPAADQHRSRLEVRTPTRAAVAEADPDRVRQIIRILMDNALGHTPEGVKVTVTTTQDSGRAELIVSDEGGPGIGPRTQARIFERFYSGEASGSGLGLAIAREFAEAMDGRLGVVSSKGFTAFILELPEAQPLPDATPDAPDTAQSGAPV